MRGWLWPPKPAAAKREKGAPKPLPKDTPLRYSDATPPKVLTLETINEAICHLSRSDPKLGALIARVGPDALAQTCPAPGKLTQSTFFDKAVRSITFVMVSVDAGNAFLRKLAIKCGVAVEWLQPAKRRAVLDEALSDTRGAGEEYAGVTSGEQLLELLLSARTKEVLFTVGLMRNLLDSCDTSDKKLNGWPHLCGPTGKCGKNDDPAVFLREARAHAADAAEGKKAAKPVSAGYSKPKAEQLISIVCAFENGEVCAHELAAASDRRAMAMLMALKGIGDWSAGEILMHFLARADVMIYGDLTIRNYLNDLYDINHRDDSETLLMSAADFADNAVNRNLIDAVGEANGWAGYRSVVCYLMYHLQEDNLVLV